MATLQQSIEALTTSRGKTPQFVFTPNVIMQDDSDGTGAFIAMWDEPALGPWPTVADGFTESQLRKAPK